MIDYLLNEPEVDVYMNRIKNGYDPCEGADEEASDDFSMDDPPTPPRNRFVFDVEAESDYDELSSVMSIMPPH